MKCLNIMILFSLSGILADYLMSAEKGRQYFIDNLRVAMTLLVVAHHAMITYSGTGGWYYMEGRQDTATVVVSAIFCGVNQAFFMSLFFMISAYFSAASYDRKGPGKFYADRLIRLGIPMLIYDYAIHPLIMFGLGKSNGSYEGTLAAYLKNYFSGFQGIGHGTLWFLEALLIFSFVYMVIRVAASRVGVAAPSREKRPFPGVGAVVAFMVFSGFAAFATRLRFPVGYSIPYTNMQLPYFVLYILLFWVGVVAYRNDWLTTISEKTARAWFAVTLVGILLMPVILIGGGAMDGGTDLFTGGMTWQALVYAMWEPVICVGMCAWLVVVFRSRFNFQNNFTKFLSDNAYTVYILQGPALVFFALLMKNVTLHPLIKFVVLYSLTIPGSYIASHIIRKLPYAKRVL